MIRRLTGWIVGHPWWTLACVLVVTAGFLFFVPRIKMETDFQKFLPANDRAVQLMQDAEKVFGSQEFFMIVVEAPTTVFEVSTIATIHEMESELKALHGVDDVRGPTTATVISATGNTLTIQPAAEILPTTDAEVAVYRAKVMDDRNLRGLIFSDDGRSAGILLKPNPYLDDPNALVAQVEEIAQAHEVGGLKIYVGGSTAVKTSLLESMTRDIGLITPIVLLVMEILVFLAFRTGRGVALPFLLMTLSTVWTIGLMALAGVALTPFSFFMPVMLITASKAYAIFTVNRYYEEAAHHGLLSREEIVVNTMQDMAKPLGMDALAETAGFLSLLAASLWPEKTFGLFIAAGIVFTLLLNFALLPAILALLPIPKRTRDYEHGLLPNALVRFGRAIARHRRLVLVLSGVVLVLFVVAIPRLRVETTATAYLGKTHPAMAAVNALDRDFGGSEQLSIQVKTNKPNGLEAPAVLKKLVGLEDYLKAQPEYGGSVQSLADLVREMNQKLHGDDPTYYVVPDDPKLAAQLLTLFTFSGGGLGNLATLDFSQGEVVARTKLLSSSQIADLTARVKTYLAENFPPPLWAEPVGNEQAFASLAADTVPNTELTLGLALIAAFLIVTVLLRSVVAGLVAVSPMILTIAINLGTMSYLHLPLDLASLMIGSITVGVGIDYTINFMIRWRTELARGRSLEEGHEITMRTMGRGILFNALTLTAGFAVFYLSSFSALRNFGLLINLTMLWSFVGSFVVIPALLLTLRPRFLTGRPRGSGGAAGPVQSPSEEVGSDVQR